LWPELRPLVLSLAPGESLQRTDFVRGELTDVSVAMPMRAHRDQIMLVRPDRFLAVTFWPHNSAEVVPAFRALLGGSVRASSA
jgi:hypothetical protein